MNPAVEYPIINSLTDRPTNHNLRMEQLLISTLMDTPEAFDMVAEIVSESDFFGVRHQVIYRTIAQLANFNEPYDPLIIQECLRRQGLISQAGEASYLLELTNLPVSLINVVSYAEQIHELAMYRRLGETALRIKQNVDKPGLAKLSEVIDRAESEVFTIGEDFRKGRNKKDVQPIQGLLAKVVSDTQQRLALGGQRTGLETPYNKLNEMTDGLQKGDMVVVAARPSMGKTAFAMGLAQKALDEGKAVLVFSMEMPADAIITRLLSSVGSVPQGAIRSGQMTETQWADLMVAIDRTKEYRLFIDDRNALSPFEVRSTARKVSRQFSDGLDLIIVDYLQLMSVGGKSDRNQEISEISRSLKALAKEMNCPVIALSQLNRSLESRGDKRPVMSDLRESGAIEQDADIIMFIYRDEVYNKQNRDKQNQPGYRQVSPEEDNRGKAEIIIGKHRNGEIGTVHLTFEGMYTRFSDIAGEGESGVEERFGQRFDDIGF